MSDESLHILIVEDNPKDAKSLEEMLGRGPNPEFELEYADRLTTCLRRLERGDIDLVLLDLFLPESRGIKTLHKVHAKAPKVAVIALTRFDDEDTGIKAVREGAQDYLVKGQVDSILLARAVRYAIERKRTKKILNEKQKNIEAIFDAAPTGMMLIDDNMIVKRVNEATKRMLHKNYLQIINQKVGNSLMC